MDNSDGLAVWQDLPPGGVADKIGGTVRKDTGFWRGGGKRPLIDLDRCVQCLHCWISCPDSCFILEDKKVVSINYQHCKGCGICAKECPPMSGAITLVDERRFQ